MLPVVYTPTVGMAIERCSHEFRRPRGVFLSVDDPENVEAALRNTGLGPDDVDLIVATDLLVADPDARHVVTEVPPSSARDDAADLARSPRAVTIPP